MRTVQVVFVVLLSAGLGAAHGQLLPDPLPEDNPDHQAMADELYPSATVCAECHPRQFEQWSYSSHAYASISPMFNKFEQALDNLASTVNYFCLRCHASVATNLGERRDIAFWERSKASKEGITCITCHRAGESAPKANGARRLIPGAITEPVYGPFDAEGVLHATVNARKYKILTGDADHQADRPGWQRIHRTAIQSDTLSESEFCVSCHQVQVHPGIKLETVWEEYRASPAAKEGVTCQDCHMSIIPGQNVGYEMGYAAEINGLHVPFVRPLGDHSFIGPGYPIIHPGLFPIRKEEVFAMETWLEFDYRAEWGSDAFENGPGADAEFPPAWANRADREKAWKIVQENLAVWELRKEKRIDLLERSSRIDGPFFNGPLEPGKALSFKYKVSNLNTGHNMPSGSLGAQPQAWLNVALVDPDGELVWESGYIDTRGDVADIHSTDVNKGVVPFDPQLFNLQAKFITTNLKGTDREMYLPVNFDVDQLPLIRPGNVPVSLLNHPPGVRMEKRSIPPLGHKWAKYKVPAEAMTKSGTYQLSVRMRSRSEPIYFMEFVGSTPDMIRAENEWITDVHAYAVEFDVGAPSERKLPPAAVAAAAAEAAAEAEAMAARKAEQQAAEAAAREAAQREAAARAAAEAEARAAAAAAAAQAEAQAAAQPAGAERKATAGMTHRVSARAAPCLTLRAEPDSSSTRLECLVPGHALEVVEQSGDWSKVRRRGGGHAWMASRFLEPIEGGGS